MSRSLVYLVVVGLSSAVSAPKLKEGAGQPVYCPTQLGAKWVYDEAGRERTLQVTGVDDRKDETLVTVSDVTTGVPGPYETLSVVPGRVFRVGVGTDGVESSCVFRSPVTEGDRWTSQTESRGGAVGETRTTTVGATEAVEVPAGKFQAARIEITITARNGRPLDKPEQYVTWHAAEVGMVKTTLNGRTIRVLNSFTPGPAAPAKK